MENCYDAIGIFLCIHINFRYQAIMQRRNLTCLDVLVHNTVYIAWNKKLQILVAIIPPKNYF